jgi:hypothetical protein
MERYHRHIVYHKFFPDDQFRPYVSVPTLADAVRVYDDAKDDGIVREMKVIDVEHIDMGDMLVHPDCTELVAQIRARRG